MIHFTLEQVLNATSGQLLVSAQRLFTGVSTDTRTIQPGDLYVALRGERVNGHDFLQQARDKGAAGAIVEESIPGVRRRHTVNGEWTIIEVTDTLYALGQLAKFHRMRFKLPVIGITGSAGKTTTKEMTAAILAQSRQVLKTHGNFNNEIGLPLTLFQLTNDHEAAVVEFGMRGRGQISYLASIAQPTVGIITNIGVTHLELLGSQDEIALAKAELLDEMTRQTTAVLPRHDKYFPLLSEHAPGQIVTVGDADDCDIWISDVRLGEDGCAMFILHNAGTDIPIHLSAPGRHQVLNALAAAAATSVIGATAQDIQQGLASYTPEKGRMRAVHASRGFTVIDDTYNANPPAVRATLDFLAEVPGGRKIAILGDMLELGPTERDIHREIGKYAMQLGIDTLLAVGELGQEYIAGANDTRAHWCPDNTTAAAAVLHDVQPGDIVLVKGSRAMKMEEIVAAITAE
ncbi:MAG TPA: UDP-N-acetylmuramoyl-tripeptide--D-alanyl-D-alanine ligase [Armatimonadota bacterium]|nr:UDP-N-acetylmuramoyl-tripeptide--D-alanyl-D-alanine ligase [Armatimonadota bacterium]